MDLETQQLIFITVCLALLILAVWWYIFDARRNRRKAAELWQAYHQAIQDGNKRLALQLGRNYYSTLRGGKLSVFDELSIANDLSTIASKSGSSTQQ